MSVATHPDPEAANGVVGWGLWEGQSFVGSSVHESKRSLLIGYDFMSLRGLRSCEERLLIHGREACRTEVTIGRRRPGTLHSIARDGVLVPYALEWSCLSPDSERTRESAAFLLASHPERVGVTPSDLELDALNRFHSFDTLPGDRTRARQKRQQRDLDNLRERVRMAFASHGIEVVPVAFRRLETPRSIEPFTCPKGWRIKKRFKLELIELVDNWGYNGFRNLEVFAAMARTTWKPGGGDAGPFELLSRSSCVNSSSIAPFTGEEWCQDLRRRFHHILLHRTTGAAEEWREKNGIRLGKTFTVDWPTAEQIHPPYWDSNGRRALSATEKVDRLLGERGWLAWSLNTCWPYATRIHSLHLQFGTGGASVGLTYGFPRGSSSWGVDLAHQKPGEPLIFTIERAQRRLEELKDPNAEPPRIGLKGEPARPAAQARDEHAGWDPPGWLEGFRQMREFLREPGDRLDDC